MSNSIEQLIEQFWSGNLSPEQRRKLLEQIEAVHPGWTNVLQEQYLRSLHTQTDAKDVSIDFESQLQKIKNRIHAQATETVMLKPIPVQGVKWWMAAAVLLPAAGVLSFLLLKSTRYNSSAVTSVAGVPVVQAVKVFYLNNQSATPEKRILPDGSGVVLYPGSKLVYNNDYGVRERRLELTEGEAFFEVAKDKKHPFTIITGMVKVRALGTAFTVKKLNKDQIKVQLEEGSVAVHTGLSGTQYYDDVYMKPGQQLLIDLAGNYARLSSKAAVGVSKKEPVAAVAPKENNYILRFEQQSMVQVLDTLKKYYSVNIDYKTEEMNGLWFTGSFKKGDTLPTILLTICKLNGLAYRYENGGYIITKK